MSVVRLLMDIRRFSDLGVVPEDLKNYGIDCVPYSSISQGTGSNERFDLAFIADDQATPDKLKLISNLRSASPACKFMVLLNEFGSNATSYLQVGTTGLLMSIPESARLVEIIRLILNDRYYLDQNIAQLLAMRQIKKQLEPFSALSSREFDVFCQLAEGLSLQSIASQLAISSKTVSNCQTQIKLKLAIYDRDQIALFAKKHGLLIDKGV